LILKAISVMIKCCATANQRSSTEHSLYTMEKPEVELLVHDIAN
jgi:hypothetical protein